MIGRDFSTNRDQRVFSHAEFREFALGLDLLFTEIAAVGLDHIVRTARARTELQRHVTVLVLRAMGNDLALQQLQHRHRHMFTGFGEHPGHSDLLCDDTRTHF